MTKTIKRDHIINVAMDLFYANGFHATGVEKIITKSQGFKKNSI